ncbi:hypothetical protein KEM55_005646 [Ascosphaera atra]|nr:hypothetical protein KEM55_005646 [Ascosphaera atra]
MVSTTFKLNTGATIPAIGLGTWQDAKAMEDAVYNAIKHGYRHIDCATVYQTEDAVGNGIRKSGVPRDQLFITTKLWSNAHHPDDVLPACKESLERMKCDYFDLYLMHWPVAYKRGHEMQPKNSDGSPATVDIDYVDTYKAMEKLLDAGLVKAIGISNFAKHEVERVLKEANVVPAVHQLECHPWLQQKSFIDWHKSKGIHCTGYSALGNQNALYKQGSNIPPLIEDPTIKKIAEKHNKTPAQIALAWGVNNGHSVLVKSKTPSRIKENFESDFKLSDEDMKELYSIDKKRRFNDSSKEFGYDFFTDLDGKQH